MCSVEFSTRVRWVVPAPGVASLRHSYRWEASGKSPDSKPLDCDNNLLKTLPKTLHCDKKLLYNSSWELKSTSHPLIVTQSVWTTSKIPSRWQQTELTKNTLFVRNDQLLYSCWNPLDTNKEIYLDCITHTPWPQLVCVDLETEKESLSEKIINLNFRRQLFQSESYGWWCGPGVQVPRYISYAIFIVLIFQL